LLQIVSNAKTQNLFLGQLPWRPVDLRYKRNEIYIDVIESVNLLMSTAGMIIFNYINAQL